MTIKVGTTTLGEKDYDKRDFIAGTVIKNFDKLTPPSELMRGISETYYQGRLGACTGFGTTHKLKIQNEREYKTRVELNPLDLRAKMGHSITKYDGGDSAENAIKTALKLGIAGKLDGKDYLFKADLRCYGKRDSWRQGLMLFPLGVVIKGNSKTWEEMLDGEVKTIGKYKDGHFIVLCGYDQNYIYFYNSFGDKINKEGISNFKISKSNFEKAISVGMINWRRFALVDKQEFVDYALHIEYSKQVIKPLKKLYEIGDEEVKKKLEECGLTKFLENKFGFKYE